MTIGEGKTMDTNEMKEWARDILGCLMLGAAFYALSFLGA